MTFILTLFLIVYLKNSFTIWKFTHAENKLLLLEDYDFACIKFLFHNPMHLFFGVGLRNQTIYAIDYLPLHSIFSSEPFIFTLRRGFVKILVESGIIGTLLFLKFLYRIFIQVNVLYKNIFICLILLFFINIEGLFPVYMILFAFLISMSNNIEIKQSNVKL